MDIVTHAMMGAIAASPFLQSHPEAAAAFMFGSVAPDLDAFSRRVSGEERLAILDGDHEALLADLELDGAGQLAMRVFHV
jgi:hypothetical protein